VDHGFIRLDDRNYINGGAQIELKKGSQLTTKDIWINGKIKGKESTSIVKVSGR
jgi:hypothetical protein